MTRKQQAKQPKPPRIATIAPLSIEAAKKEKLEAIARRHHRDLSKHLRWLIDQHLAEQGEDAA